MFSPRLFFFLSLIMAFVAAFGLVACGGDDNDDDDDTGDDDDDDDDSGPGAPPVIDHTPLGDQPSGFGDYQVRATITDDGAVAGAKVIYSVSGSEEATVDMAVETGDVYVGVIPDQIASAMVTYRIEATDDHEQLTATDNYSFNVLAAIEIWSDDETAEDGLRAIAAGDKLLVGFTPPMYPVKPARVRIKVHAHPDDVGKQVSGVVYLDPSAAGPTGDPAFTSDPVTVQATETWLDLDIAACGLSVDSGDFIVGITSADGKTPFVGLDTSGTFSTKAWYGRSGGIYDNLGNTPFEANPLIRAVILLPPGGAK